jgi:hypothetical protein
VSGSPTVVIVFVRTVVSSARKSGTPPASSYSFQGMFNSDTLGPALERERPPNDGPRWARAAYERHKAAHGERYDVLYNVTETEHLVSCRGVYLIT